MQHLQNFYVAGIKSERRDFKEARAPSEFWSCWSAKLKSIFFSFFSRFNNDPVKKMEEATLTWTKYWFYSPPFNLKQIFIFSPDLKSIVIKIPINQNHLLLVQFLPSKSTAHAQV